MSFWNPLMLELHSFFLRVHKLFVEIRSDDVFIIKSRLNLGNSLLLFTFGMLMTGHRYKKLAWNQQMETKAKPDRPDVHTLFPDFSSSTLNYRRCRLFFFLLSCERYIFHPAADVAWMLNLFTSETCRSTWKWELNWTSRYRPSENTAVHTKCSCSWRDVRLRRLGT